MARSKLILVPSTKMDGNKKEGRQEHNLIRLPKVSREYLDSTIKIDPTIKLELYSDTGSTETRINSSKLLTVFKAFAGDIKRCKDKGMTPEELVRVGFVTTSTFNKIAGSELLKENSIWVANDINDTVIGADPEFLLFDKDGGVIRANNVLSYHSALGCDGAMAEVRPKPAIQPEGLVKNISEILHNKNLTDPIKQYNWIAGCYHKDQSRDYPIGGHIHIGNPIQIANMGNNDRMAFFNVLNKIIDELLAVPMIKIDGAFYGAARRTKCTMGKYGYYGEWRPCDGRLEHRTLSGMWLMHPTLATCVLGTVKAIIDEVFRLVTDSKFDINYMFPDKLKGVDLWHPDFKEWKSIPLAIDMGCTADSKYMTEALHKSNASKISIQFIKNWHKRMKGLSTYETYAKYIDGLAEMLKINHKEYNRFDKSIQKNWIEGKKFIVDF